ncbi:fluoride efflux transporter CrcB [Beggiatoa leptomitoformis]|uniref:Fluoride-specific ion channel FluC n=1 Tax=Beggiatoa leptomitoformis TaxID=288004 RepID=A0A2N9YFT0_9GAMM|nr:fluoride efflux transporter CrcB [Beggiatoa leptomitoformis]ALG68348.1 fluoride efflux transporter CrcB [Beggiatoa leptomitoformis]AUI69333.1 fluoride efflux transporter CrcB [Beggiatoa leptomitoformis]
MHVPLSFYLWVGLGGFVGSVARYAVALWMARFTTGFPLGTLLVNITGCFLIALIAGLASKTHLISPEMRLLLATGFCGGFTTFSSLMYEVMTLLEEGQWFYVSIYVGGSVIGGFLAVYMGLWLVEKWV